MKGYEIKGVEIYAFDPPDRGRRIRDARGDLLAPLENRRNFAAIPTGPGDWMPLRGVTTTGPVNGYAVLAWPGSREMMFQMPLEDFRPRGLSMMPVDLMPAVPWPDDDDSVPEPLIPDDDAAPAAVAPRSRRRQVPRGTTPEQKERVAREAVRCFFADPSYRWHTALDYTEWRQAQDTVWPSYKTIARIFGPGSWRDLTEKALAQVEAPVDEAPGPVEPAQRGAGRPTRWSRSDILGHLREFALAQRAQGAPYNSDIYKVWARENGKASIATVARHVGTWREVVAWMVVEVGPSGDPTPEPKPKQRAKPSADDAPVDVWTIADDHDVVETADSRMANGILAIPPDPTPVAAPKRRWWQRRDRV